jgi:hypothetical protein
MGRGKKKANIFFDSAGAAKSILSADPTDKGQSSQCCIVCQKCAIRTDRTGGTSYYFFLRVFARGCFELYFIFMRDYLLFFAFQSLP